MAKKENEEAKVIIQRLDAVIRLLIELNKSEKDKKFSEIDAAKLLQSLDLTPTEIAKVLGKKRVTDVSKYLYSKKKK